MLSQISWADYASTVAAIAMLYYIVITLHYYRYEIAYYFSAKDKQTKISFSAEPVKEAEEA